MKVKFYQHMTALEIARLWLFSEAQNQFYYFSISKTAKMMIDLLHLEKQFICSDVHLFDLRNVSGESYYPEIIQNDLINLSERIQKQITTTDGFVKDFVAHFDQNKMMLFLRKIVYRDILDLIFYLKIIHYSQETNRVKESGRIEFIVNEIRLSDIVKNYAITEYNILLINRHSLKSLLGFLYRFFGYLSLSILTCLKPFINARTWLKKPSADSCVNPAPVVSVLYTLGGVTFGRTKRCDFPWLLTTNVPHHQILMYFERKDMPVTDEMFEVLRQKEIKCIAMSAGASKSKNIEVNELRREAARTMWGFINKLVPLAFKELVNGRFRSLAYFPELLNFTREYSEAYDFYLRNRIKINVAFLDLNPYRIARDLALRATGGVSISYQVSNWPIPNITFGSGADTMFLFGPHYRSILQRSGACNENYVISGYFSDYSFTTVEDQAKELKRSLLNNGAKFILSYFDENSSDARMSLSSNDTSLKIYKKLLDWVLNDEKIGLICSPKRPMTLLKRLPEIAELIKDAEATGRCIFMSGSYAAENYPVEAAKASDMAIALLMGGTVSLESYLAGLRSVYLDLEGLYAYPEYKQGKDKIVFDDVDSLISAIKRYSSNRVKYDDIGNVRYFPNFKKKDPFQDGNASLRMGQYINWLYEKFKSGESRDNAIEYANRNYAEQWGSEYVQKWH